MNSNTTRPVSRSELVSTIENQEAKIKKYEKKLKDVISAYKGLLKEKEALEASIKILSQNSPPEKQNDVKDDSLTNLDQDREAENSEQICPTDPLSLSVSEKSDNSQATNCEILTLKEQLATLTNSLSTVTEEKSKMQANFLAEKKQLNQEFTNTITSLEEDVSKKTNEVINLTSQLQESKNKIRTQQHDIEQGHTEHGHMLRELQALLAEERISKEQTEIQIEDLKLKITENERTLKDNNKYQQKIKELNNLLDIQKETLSTMEKKLSEPVKNRDLVKKELAKSEAQHKVALEKEHKQCQELREQNKQISAKNEVHIANLESKLAELSKTIGEYDKVRSAESAANQKLQEQLAQAENENAILVQSAKYRRTNTSDLDQTSDTEEPLFLKPPSEVKSTEELINCYFHFKSYFTRVNTELDARLEEAEFFATQVADPDALHAACRADQEALREEFERYKLRAQSVLKSRRQSPQQQADDSAADHKAALLESELRAQLSDARRRERDAQRELSDNNARHASAVSDLRRAADDAARQHADELNQAADTHRRQQAELEAESRRQRDRTVALLADKERDIDALQLRVRTLQQQQGVSTAATSYAPPGAPTSPAICDESSAAVSLLLSRCRLGGDTSEHAEGEAARREQEVSVLRRQRRELEAELRAARQDAADAQRRSRAELELLRGEAEEHAKSRTRQLANVEYLKHVTHRYMLCTDQVGKTRMLNAIAAILEFSGKEKADVQAVIAGGWW